jgi:hypothetical protein
MRIRHDACLAEGQETLPKVEDRMARWTRIVPAFAAALALAACGQEPSDTPLSPPAARFEAGGGSTLGGNFTPPGDSVSAGRTATSAPTSAEAPLVPDDSTHRGGSTLGGN